MSARQQIPFLSADELAALDIAWRDVIERIEHLIHRQSEARVWSAPKATFETPDGRYAMNTMAAAADPPFLITKALLLNPRNPDAGQPLMSSIITVQDAETGAPLATMDGNWITAVRTAALSATAATRLARPGAKSIAFIGCGLQARQHLAAFAEFFELRNLVAFGRGQANIDRLTGMANELGLRTSVATSPEDAMREADIVVSSISRDPTLAPFIDAGWVSPGAFASLTDLGAQWMPDTLGCFDRIIVDDLEQEQVMKKKLAPPDIVTGDLAGLVLEQIPGRNSDSERTAFIFRGHALGDFALASLAYERWALQT